MIMATTHETEHLKDHPAEPKPDSLTEQEHADRIHRRKDELLDQGVEETFPASDPVAVKQIT
jgi:hypothetical protein